MNSLAVKYFIILLVGFIICLNAEPEPKPKSDPVNDGKYRPRNNNKSKFNDGKYVPNNQASISIRSIDFNNNIRKGQFYQQHYNNKNADFGRGKYVHKVQPYVHVHDNRELGRYVHIHIPYDGGYGPYSGDQDRYRYLFDNRGDYSLYTVSNYDDKDPFNNQFYDIPKPEVLLEYGFPDHSPNIEKRCILPSLSSSSLQSTQSQTQTMTSSLSSSKSLS